MHNEFTALLDDDEEWFNIPPILRKLFRLMSEEEGISRKLIETLRVEQDETNTHVRKLFQKQTNMEIDVAKNALMTNIKSKSDEEYKLIESLKSLKKKVSKNQEDLKHTQEKIKLLPDEDLIISRIDARVAEAIESVDNKICDVMTQFDAQRILVNDVISKSNESIESFNFLKKEHAETNRLTLEHTSRLLDLETKVDRLFKLIEECEECSRNFSRLSKEFSDYEAVCEKRFKSMFNSFEKIDAICEKQRTLTDDLMQRCAADTGEKVSSLRGEIHRITMEAHDFVTSATTLMRKDIVTLQDSVQSLKKKSNDNCDFIEKTQTAMSANTKQVARLESVLSKLEGQFIKFSDVLDRNKRSEANQLQAFAEERNQMLNEITQLKNQTEHIDTRVGDVRAFCKKVTDTLQHNIEQLRSSIHEISEGQLRTDAQSERLHRLVGSISDAMDKLETAMVQRCTLLQKQEEQRKLFTESEEKERMLALCEHLRATLTDTTKEIHHEVDERHACVENLDRQLKAANLKIRNLEEIISTATQKIEYLQQNHSTWKSWQEEALKEVSPVLMEVEAIKRRIAFIETKISDLNCDISNDKIGMSVRLLRESVEEGNHRVQDLSRRLLSLEKRFSTFTSDVHDMDDRLQGSENLTSKLGHDLTRALENIVEEGNTITRIQTFTDTRFEELSAKIAILDQKMNQSVSAIHPSFAPPSTNVEEFLHEWRQRIGEELFAKQQGLIMRVDELDRLVQKWSGAAPSRDLQACENGMLTQVDSGCANNNVVNKEGTMKNNDAFTPALECITREIQSLWQALHTIHSPDLGISEGDAAHQHRGDSPQCLQTDVLPHPVHDIAEIEKVVETCVKFNLLNLTTKLGTDLSESVDEQCDLLSRKYAEQAENLESALETIQSSLEQLQDRFDAKSSDLEANLNEHQGRLDTMESVLRNLLDKYKQLIEDVRCLQEILRNFPCGPEGGRGKSPEETRIQLDDLTKDDFTHLEMRIRQLEEDVQRLPLAGLLVSQTPSASVMVGEADPRKEDVLPELLRRETNLLEERMNAAFCTKVLLEERFATLQKSIENLLEYKEDKDAADDKIDELHELITEEMSIQFRKLQNDFMNMMAEKVSLNELQEILDRDACEVA
ncbi:unnamed protein product [Phytomonas sp. EM1]|nr:unnamed protein product [Phytomonas sp. EM1]|eukprot:CCW65016.1 unnamed protein product [Phytomonas sp. isolate EM1]